MTVFEWKTFFVWRVTYICVYVTQAQILPTSSKHVSPGMRFLGPGIGGLSHQSCMSLHIGTNNIVGGSTSCVRLPKCVFAIHSRKENHIYPWHGTGITSLQSRIYISLITATYVSKHTKLCVNIIKNSEHHVLFDVCLYRNRNDNSDITANQIRWK